MKRQNHVFALAISEVLYICLILVYALESILFDANLICIFHQLIEAISTLCYWKNPLSINWTRNKFKVSLFLRYLENQLIFNKIREQIRVSVVGKNSWQHKLGACWNHGVKYVNLKLFSRRTQRTRDINWWIL